MRILFIRSNPVFPDPRVEKEMIALSDEGHIVTLLAWDRSSNYSIRKELVNDNVKEIEAFRVGIKSMYGTGMKNIRNLLKFLITIRKFLHKHYFDVIHACDFDTAFVTYYSIDHKKTKLVYDIFDYYVDAYNVPKLLRKIIIQLDRNIINKASCVIICTEERKKQIKGTKPKQLIVIHNSPSEKELRTDSLIINHNENSKIKICYVGILQPGRLLVEISEIVQKQREYELHIAGFGEYEKYFEDLSKKCSNIHYYGKIPYQKTLTLENNCDIMLAIYDPNITNHRFAAPNKFYEALMLGKPLIMVKGTGMSRIVKNEDIGILIDYSEEGFIKGVNELIQRKEEWTIMSQRMKSLYKRDYSWNEMEKRLCALYDDLSND